jgi:hypothetical protein
MSGRVDPIELKPVDRIRITTQIDNLTDPLLVGQDGVARVNCPRALAGLDNREAVSADVESCVLG